MMKSEDGFALAGHGDAPRSGPGSPHGRSPRTEAVDLGVEDADPGQRVDALGQAGEGEGRERHLDLVLHQPELLKVGHHLQTDRHRVGVAPRIGHDLLLGVEDVDRVAGVR